MATTINAITNEEWLTLAQYNAKKQAGTLVVGKKYHIKSKVIEVGNTTPTSSTIATNVGQFYLNTTDNKLYICNAISGSTYTWQEVGGSSGVEIDDTTTSTTKVWSSNKVNSELGNKQNTINSSNKVNADYIDDSNSTNKFATIPIITFTNNEVITPYTYLDGKAYLTLNVSNEIKAILKRTYQSSIKVDLSTITNIPVPYVWIKKNVAQTMQSIDLLQYSFDNAGFDFGHAQDQTNPYIKMIKIGNGGAIYVESLNRLYIAFTNISDDALWQGINAKASINDTTPSSTTTYSSTKINTELGNKASVIFVDWS